MHARVTTVHLQEGTTDRAITIFQDSVAPAAREQRGFKSGLLLTDRTTGKAVVITLWATEADLRQSEDVGYYQEQMMKFAGVAIFAGPPARETYEVSAQV